LIAPTNIRGIQGAVFRENDFFTKRVTQSEKTPINLTQQGKSLYSLNEAPFRRFTPLSPGGCRKNPLSSNPAGDGAASLAPTGGNGFIVPAKRQETEG
jgi:hypothetical protein